MAFTDAQLAAAYKQAAHNHRFIFHELPTGRLFSFEDRVRHGSIVWHLSVRVSWFDHKFYIKVAASKKAVVPPKVVSAEGVSVSIFRNRRCLVRYVASASTVVLVPGALCIPGPDNDGREKGQATIIVHVPATAFVGC